MASRELARRAGEAAEASPEDPDLPALAPAGSSSPTSTATTRRPPRSDLPTRLGSPLMRSPAAGDIRLYGFFTSGAANCRGRHSAGFAGEQTLHGRRGSGARRNRRRLGLRRADLVGGSETSIPPRSRAKPPSSRRGRANADELRAGRRTARCSSRTRSASCCSTSRSTPSAGSALLEERSYLGGKLGERHFDEKVSIVDDALDPRGLPKAFDFEGVPKRACPAGRERRRSAASVWDSASAARAGGSQARPATPPRPAFRRCGTAAVRALARWRRGRVGRRTGRARRRRHLHHAPALPGRRRAPPGNPHRHDPRRDLPHPRREARRAARQPPLHGRRAGGARGRARPHPRDDAHEPERPSTTSGSPTAPWCRRSRRPASA